MGGQLQVVKKWKFIPRDNPRETKETQFLCISRDFEPTINTKYFVGGAYTTTT